MARESKKILVTGGLGFIGSNLVGELERRGHEVWVCDVMHCGMENYFRCNVSKYRQVERMFDGRALSYYSSKKTLQLCKAHALKWELEPLAVGGSH